MLADFCSSAAVPCAGLGLIKMAGRVTADSSDGSVSELPDQAVTYDGRPMWVKLAVAVIFLVGSWWILAHYGDWKQLETVISAWAMNQPTPVPVKARLPAAPAAAPEASAAGVKLLYICLRALPSWKYLRQTCVAYFSLVHRSWNNALC